jgi:hypothetical protein
VCKSLCVHHLQCTHLPGISGTCILWYSVCTCTRLIVQVSKQCCTVHSCKDLHDQQLHFSHFYYLYALFICFGFYFFGSTRTSAVSRISISSILRSRLMYRLLNDSAISNGLHRYRSSSHFWRTAPASINFATASGCL